MRRIKRFFGKRFMTAFMKISKILDMQEVIVVFVYHPEQKFMEIHHRNTTVEGAHDLVHLWGLPKIKQAMVQEQVNEQLRKVTNLN